VGTTMPRCTPVKGAAIQVCQPTKDYNPLRPERTVLYGTVVEIWWWTISLISKQSLGTDIKPALDQMFQALGKTSFID